MAGSLVHMQLNGRALDHVDRKGILKKKPRFYVLNAIAFST